jgi:hypothetical protein
MFDVMTLFWLGMGVAVIAFAFLEYSIAKKKKL